MGYLLIFTYFPSVGLGDDDVDCGSGDDGDIVFVAEFEERFNGKKGTRFEKRQTTQFAVFEHLDPRIPGSTNHDAGDRITIKDQDKFFADLESFWTDNGNDMRNFPLQKSQDKDNCLGFNSKFH